MGWTISHGARRPGHPLDGVHCRSYTQVDQWLAAIKATLTTSELAALAPLLTRLSGNSTADPFQLRPKQAERIAVGLRVASYSVPPQHKELTTALADAALRAFTAGQPWRWH